MKALEARKEIQEILHVSADGQIGQRALAALTMLSGLDDEMEWPPVIANPPSSGVHHVKASSFADKADVAAFRKCKAAGGSDQFCFGKGDNGIGFTELDCTDESIPYVALPPEHWKPKFGSAKAAEKKPVLVTIDGKTVECVIGDTMPHLANIHNGAGIDLAPGAQKAFGLSAPFMVEATWQWLA